MKQIYNEGRVVGLNAYELYLRQQLSEDPSALLPSEREWLSTTVGSGNSMILKIAAGTEAGYHDYKLPETSELCACSHIFANAFVGKAKFDEDDLWAIKVIDYGQLIENTYDSNPVTPGETVPTSVTEDFEPSDDFKTICTEYLKIADGIVYAPGTWTDYLKEQVGKEFQPDISKKNVIRLWMSEEIEHDTFIMFHGFLFKSVLSGTTGFDGCMDTASPQNGDFLGPMSYPWAVKITFTVSNDVYAIVNKVGYERILPDLNNSSGGSSGDGYEWGELPDVPDDDEAAGVSLLSDENPSNSSRMISLDDTFKKRVDSKPLIDFATSDPSDYYQNYYDSSKLPIHVTDFNMPVKSGANVIALYQQDEHYNGALYGANITEEGKQYMYPLDTAAPGQMRVFTDEQLASDYPTIIPNVYGIFKNELNHLFIFDEDGNKIDLSNDLGVETNPAHTASVMATVTSGDDVIKTISLTDEVNGRLFETSGARDTKELADKSVQSIDFLDWTALLQGLSEEKAIEVVGKLLKKYRDNIEFITDAQGNKINTGSKNNYIEFSTALDSDGISSGKRLYISSTAPTGTIPDGSLGIGW